MSSERMAPTKSLKAEEARVSKMERLGWVECMFSSAQRAMLANAVVSVIWNSERLGSLLPFLRGKIQGTRACM